MSPSSSTTTTNNTSSTTTTNHPSNHPKLILSEVTPADYPSLGPIFFQSFHTHPYFQRMQPRTPATEATWVNAAKIAVEDPYTISLKVVDSSDPDNPNKIVSHGRWVRPRNPDDREQPGEEEGRWADIPETCDEELAEALFGSFARHREGMMGMTRHYCSGAGSMILKYGCDLADKDQMPCYIDSSPRGRKLYEIFGFVFTEKEDLPMDYHYDFGIREPKKSGE